MRGIGVLAAAVLSATSTQVCAQIVLHSEVKLAPYSTDGRLHGCAVEFTVLYSDSVGRRGATSGLGGTVGFVAPPKGIVGLIFKLTARDWPGANPSGSPVAVPISSGLIRMSGKSVPLAKRVSCDSPNDYCAAGSADAALDALMALNENQMMVGFGRGQGARDTIIPVQLSGTELFAAANCALELLTNISGRK